MSYKAEKLEYKIGILGCPSMHNVEWNSDNVKQLKDYGFNEIQLNIAWGARPGDDPLNLEDVVLTESNKDEIKHFTSTPERIEERVKELRRRIKICKEEGMRTLFHFGAPYNGISGYKNEKLSKCLLDGHTQQYYVEMLKAFAIKFKGVDDLLIYTYDQDAWLCDEFGVCENCYGIPLHKRVTDFINLLGQTWSEVNSGGRLWWEPWELSAGQALKCVDSLNSEHIGLMLHSNIAEVMATLPVDRYVKNMCSLANEKGIPVIIEGFFGAASEEVEPYTHLAHPLVTFRQLKAMNNVNGVVGVKEYFGLIPTKEDPNLEITSIFFKMPDIDEKGALNWIANKYGPCKSTIIDFWVKCSQGMELFPWDVSWFARKQGTCDISHTLNAAFLRGQMCHTPSWESSRKCIFMKTDDLEPDPWLLEDIGLRCNLAGGKMKEALEIGQNMLASLPLALTSDFKKGLEELELFIKVCVSYSCHIRETNLACLIRKRRTQGAEVPKFIISELFKTFEEDILNQGGSKEIDEAIEVLKNDIDEFLKKYFTIPALDIWVKGPHTFTSR